MRRLDEGYRFEGRGSGHGVGMCVIGSTRLAARGQTAREILSRYFPGTAIESMREGHGPIVCGPGTRGGGASRHAGAAGFGGGSARRAPAAGSVDVTAHARRDLDALVSRSRLELATDPLRVCGKSRNMADFASRRPIR